MDTFKSFERKIYEVNDHSFTDIALALFRFQASENNIYRSYIQHLGIDPGEIKTLESIPFLPISFFKSQVIRSGSWDPDEIFLSSGTTASTPSRHYVYDKAYYLAHARSCFEHFFGSLERFHFLALLPSYLEREGSSLVAMMDFFIRESKSPHSGFYLYETERLINDVGRLKQGNRIPIVWGVSFALLDLAETHGVDLSHCHVFETGGMKGRRREITREELHAVLKSRFNVQDVYSEYGMTELLSQAYTRGGMEFHTPPWMKIIGRELTDPMRKGLQDETSGINVIDLANWHSVAFIETEDIGKIRKDGSFEVLGRMDNSEIRGCNLLVN